MKVQSNSTCLKLKEVPISVLANLVLNSLVVFLSSFDPQLDSEPDYSIGSPVGGTNPNKPIVYSMSSSLVASLSSLSSSFMTPSIKSS